MNKWGTFHMPPRTAQAVEDTARFLNTDVSALMEKSFWLFHALAKLPDPSTYRTNLAKEKGATER